mgnify:CR=1 FL=1
MSYLQTKNQYITVEGLKIAYRELGQGKSQYPLVMLVHLAATMDNWDPKLIDNLAEKNHIIVMDLPGVGASEGENCGKHSLHGRPSHCYYQGAGLPKNQSPWSFHGRLYRPRNCQT